MTRTAIQRAELAEHERHNKEQERIGRIGNIINAIGSVASVAGAAGTVMRGAGTLAQGIYGKTRTGLANGSKPSETYISNRNTNYNFNSGRNGFRR